MRELDEDIDDDASWTRFAIGHWIREDVAYGLCERIRMVEDVSGRFEHVKGMMLQFLDIEVIGCGEHERVSTHLRGYYATLVRRADTRLLAAPPPIMSKAMREAVATCPYLVPLLLPWAASCPSRLVFEGVVIQ